jgi:VanZ family protein
MGDIDYSFSGVFLLLLLIAAYAGLTSIQLGQYVNDKVLHFITFFTLTVLFYWVVDTNRRRVMNMTLVICTIVLGVGSQFVQSFLDNGREFDLYDIVANVIGSLLGVGLCSWYHKRMLERKRRRRYSAVPGEDEGDVELGEGHETGVVDETSRTRTLEEEVDNWDENQIDDDWDEEEAHEASTNTHALDNSADIGDLADSKKRMD